MLKFTQSLKPIMHSKQYVEVEAYMNASNSTKISTVLLPLGIPIIMYEHTYVGIVLIQYPHTDVGIIHCQHNHTKCNAFFLWSLHGGTYV